MKKWKLFCGGLAALAGAGWLGVGIGIKVKTYRLLFELGSVKPSW